MTIPTNETIIRGTLRTDDLLDAFIGMLPADQQTAIRGELEQVGDDEQARDMILHETVWPAMEAIAPAGTSFGHIEGDGSDFGFWTVEDEDADDAACAYCQVVSPSMSYWDAAQCTCPDEAAG